jgi:hypothetical protein
LNILLQKGFNRLLVDGEVKEIEEVLKEPVEVKKEAKAAKKTVAKKSASKKKVTSNLPVVQPVSIELSFAD